VQMRRAKYFLLPNNFSNTLPSRTITEKFPEKRSGCDSRGVTWESRLNLTYKMRPVLVN
jgi:hypothetical protein